MRLEISEQEARVLRKLVEEELETINPEIRHSATSQFRIELREERNALKRLLAALDQSELQSMGGIF